MTAETPADDDVWGLAELLGLVITRSPRVRPDAPVYSPTHQVISIAEGLAPDDETRMIMWVIQRDVLLRRN